MIDTLPIKRICLDTNALIEAFEGRGPVSGLLRKLLVTEPRDGKQLLVTSHYTLAEIMVKPLQDDRPELVEVYDSWTSTNSHLEGGPLVRPILREAAALRASNGSLKLGDAIHLATALAFDCSHFVSNDKQLQSAWPGKFVRLVEEEIRDLLESLRHG